MPALKPKVTALQPLGLQPSGWHCRRSLARPFQPVGPLCLGLSLSWTRSPGEMIIALTLWLPGSSYCLAAIEDYLETQETDLGGAGRISLFKALFPQTRRN